MPFCLIALPASIALFKSPALAASLAAAHFHCCIIVGVFAVGEDGQIHFAEVPALVLERVGPR